MVARASSTRDLHGDRFVDWLFNLTDEVGKTTGLSEKQSAKAVRVIIEKVQREYGGRSPYVHSQGRPSKRDAILERWGDGFTVSKIAADVGCSEDWVRKVVSDIPVAKGEG